MAKIADATRPWWGAPVAVGILCSCVSTHQTLLAGRPFRVVGEQTVELSGNHATEYARIEWPAPVPGTTLLLELELQAACGPLLQVEFPDGEVMALGEADQLWQALLVARAAAGEKAVAASATSTGTSNESAVVPSNNTDAVATPEPGQWQVAVVDAWPGQSTFLRARAARCAQGKTYRVAREVALVDLPLRVMAEVPQELANAQLRVRALQVGTPRAPSPQTHVAPQTTVSASAGVAVTVRSSAVQPAPARSIKPVKVAPLPPKPAPRSEQVPHLTPYERWIAGSWQWETTSRRACWLCPRRTVTAWVWHPGKKGPGATPPPLAPPGSPPIAGCTWQNGAWTWDTTRASWQWQAGYWNPPPARAESPPAPSVEGSLWVSGYWQAQANSFVWISGYWRAPDPLADMPPPAPTASARWVAGQWLNVNGKWEWSPGYYIGHRPVMPPPKPEISGDAPTPGAVWMPGYWHWLATAWTWRAGFWESPPGVGYVWVPAPTKTPGAPVQGHWRLRIDVTVESTIRGTVRK